MNPEIIENKWVRILSGIIGVVITPISILGAIDGIALGFGGVQNNNIWTISFGLGTVLSFFGLIGAWVRIINTYELMSARKINIVRGFLVCGLLSAFFLTLGSIGIFGYGGVYFAAFFLLITAGGLVFLYSTPKP